MLKKILFPRLKNILITALFGFAAIVWIFWIIYIAVAMRDDSIPVNWTLFAVFLGGILLFLIPALLVAFPWHNRLSPWRFSITLWIITVGIYWIFAPIYSYLVINTNRTLTLWYMIPYAWEVPALGGFFVFISSWRFRTLRARLANLPRYASENEKERLRRDLTFLPVVVGLFISIVAFLGYGPIGSVQYRLGGAAPWVEIIKNIISGTTIGLLSGLIYFFTVNRIISPWFEKLPALRKKPPFPLKAKLIAIVGVVTLLSLTIFVPVAYKYSQNILQETVLDTMSANDLPQSVGTHGYTFAIDRTGAVVGSHPRGFSGIADENLEPEITRALVSGVITRTVSRRLQNRYIAAAPQGATTAIAIGYESDMRFRIRPLLGASIAVALVFGIIFTLVVILFARGIANPIERLTDAVRDMARRGKMRLLTERTGDEIEILTDEFVKMSNSLRAYEKNLEQKIAQRTVALTDANSQLKEKTLVLERVLIDVKRVDEELARLNRAKSEFISIASHQLRTPLTTIKWHSKLLKKGGLRRLNPIQRTALAQIMDANERMIALINALLNLSRIEMGALAIEPRIIQVNELIQKSIRNCGTLARARGVKVRAPALTPIKADLDPRLLEIILDNLLTNGVRYTPRRGSVTVSLAKIGSNVIIKVTDTGYGISKKDQPNIFSKFFRADSAVAKEPHGTGLGLYLTRQLVEIMKGTIQFSSKEGRGTVFIVTLPRKGLRTKKGSKGLIPMQS